MELNNVYILMELNKMWYLKLENVSLQKNYPKWWQDKRVAHTI